MLGHFSTKSRHKQVQSHEQWQLCRFSFVSSYQLKNYDLSLIFKTFSFLSIFQRCTCALIFFLSNFFTGVSGCFECLVGTMLAKLNIVAADVVVSVSVCATIDGISLIPDGAVTEHGVSVALRTTVEDVSSIPDGATVAEHGATVNVALRATLNGVSSTPDGATVAEHGVSVALRTTFDGVRTRSDTVVAALVVSVAARSTIELGKHVRRAGGFR